MEKINCLIIGANFRRQSLIPTNNLKGSHPPLPYNTDTTEHEIKLGARPHQTSFQS